MRAPVSFLRPGTPAFDPATLLPDGWFRNYGGAPWNPTAPSANGNLSAGATAPAVASINGKGVANWNTIFSGTRFLRTVGASNLFISTATTTMIAFLRCSFLQADAGAWYSEPVIIGSDSGNFGLSISSSGLRAGNGNGGSTTRIALGLGVGAMAAVRISGGQIRLRVYQPTGHADAAPVTAAGAAVDSFLKIGLNWDSSAGFAGDIAELMTWKAAAISDANLDKLALSYGNARFAWGLT